ncbi:MAG: hypothetical protein H7281_13915 [Bacteriovorax sp.]|nr:hypothetical protein [Bacteriovorax sp.]
MLNKNIDYALVGHNFITFLLSIGLLNRGKKVLVLDDDRFNYGDFFTNSLTLLDVEFLRTWGDLGDLSPLKNIDNYLSPQSVYFYVGKKQIVLGDTPLRNYRELCRKFPNLFMNDKSGSLSNQNEVMDFNNFYNNFCSKVTHSIFQEKNSSKVSKLFETSIPAELLNHFQHFFSHFANKDGMNEVDRSEFNALIFMTRGFFQNRLSTTGSRSEIMHLFFSLISPYFKLDHERLIHDLLEVHQKAGGEFKKLNLADLKFQSGLVKSFELESFEGIIKPKKMAFIGGYPVGLPIRLKTSSVSYNCLNVSLKFNNPLPKLLKDKKVIFSSPMKIGTDRPFWEVYFSESGAVFNIIMAKREGTKVDFIKERVIKLLKDDLAYLFPEYEFEIINIEMKFTLDVFIEDKDYLAYKRIEASLGVKIVEVLEDTAPLIFSRLKNVLYFGPYNEDALGTFSSLIEIKRWRESL